MYIASDVSGKIRTDKFVVIGSVWMPSKEYFRYRKWVKSFKQKFSLRREIKWSNLDHHNLSAYKEFLNQSFKKFSFRNRVLLCAPKYLWGGKHVKITGYMFAWLYWALIIFSIEPILKEFSVPKIFHIFMDKGELSEEQALLLRESLKAYFKEKKFKSFIKLSNNIDSKDCELIQLCDLIIGSIFTKFNIPSEKVSPEKREIINYINSLLEAQKEKYTIPVGTKIITHVDFSSDGLFYISRPFFEL